MENTGGRTIKRGKDRDPWKRKLFVFKKSNAWTTEVNKGYDEEPEKE